MRTIRRISTRAAIAGAALATAATIAGAPSATAMTGHAAAKLKKHTIDMTWTGTKSVRRDGYQFDTFKVRGKPWRKATAVTKTDLDEIGQDERTPTFGIVARGNHRLPPDIFQGRGRLGVKRTVLYTASDGSSQRIRYRGEGTIDDNDDPPEFEGVITSLRGTITFYADGSSKGSLHLKGYIRY